MKRSRTSSGSTNSLMTKTSISFDRSSLRNWSSRSENRRLPHGAGRFRRLFGSLSFLSDASRSGNLSERQIGQGTNALLPIDNLVAGRFEAAQPFGMYLVQKNGRNGVFTKD